MNLWPILNLAYDSFKIALEMMGDGGEVKPVLREYFAQSNKKREREKFCNMSQLHKKLDLAWIQICLENMSYNTISWSITRKQDKVMILHVVKRHDCVWRAPVNWSRYNTEQPRVGRIPSNQELVGIHNDSASKSWSMFCLTESL